MPKLIKEHTITNVIDYIKIICETKRSNESLGNNAELVFRGQCVDQPLLPRIARLELRINNNIGLRKTEELILAEFKRGILPLTEFKPEGIWDILALAQHHGLPTRLLDWTYSALAALWFAVENSPVKKDDGEYENGVVWILAAEVPDFNINFETDDPRKNDITKIFRPNVISRRISAQSGIFTVHHFRRDNTVIEFEKHSRFKNKLRKILIPYKSFASIRKDLNMLGINHAIFFPDLDGWSKHLEWRFAKLKDEKRTFK